MSNCSNNCTNFDIENYKISVRIGETFQLPSRTNDPSASTITLKVWDDTGIKIDETETFIDGQATIDAGVIALALGKYKYLLTIVYSDGHIDILPNAEECDGGTDCAIPEFEVCIGGYDG